MAIGFSGSNSRSRDGRAPIVWGGASGLLYGSCAFVVNYHVSFWQALLSAATQFGLSFFATSTLAFAMSAILALGRSPLYFAAAVIVPLNLLAAVFALAHWLAGTPHIVATIAPSYLLGLVFCVVYSTNAIRQRGALTATLSRD